MYIRFLNNKNWKYGSNISVTITCVNLWIYVNALNMNCIHMMYEWSTHIQSNNCFPLQNSYFWPSLVLLPLFQNLLYLFTSILCKLFLVTTSTHILMHKLLHVAMQLECQPLKPPVELLVQCNPCTHSPLTNVRFAFSHSSFLLSHAWCAKRKALKEALQLLASQ